MSKPTLRESWRHIIFGTDTRAGALFDQLLIVTILISVLAVMLDSVESVHADWHQELYLAEWFFTILFSIEYLVRLWVSERPTRYARSFFGVVDLLSVIPTYLSLVLPGANYMLTIRFLRVLRIFRVLKLVQFMSEAGELAESLLRARRKIGVFMFSILVLMVLFGSPHVCDRGPIQRFHQHSHEHLLGGGDHYHRGLRRHCSPDGTGQGHFEPCHDYRVRHYCRPHRYRIRRNIGLGNAPPQIWARMPQLPSF